MSIPAYARQNLAWAARPPGPQSFWHAVGTAVRGIGRQIDAVGVGLQGDCAYHEKLVMPVTAVAVGGKAPAIAAAGFVAPSANLVGDVSMGEGATAWYASLLRGDCGKPTSVGAGSQIGDRATVTSSQIGAQTWIGAGATLVDCSVGDGASIGLGATVCAGASVADGAVLTAGSVLPAGRAVPPKEVWGGSPAAKVGLASEDDVEGLAANVSLSASLAALHEASAWKGLASLEEEAADYKREGERTPESIAQMRYDPKWEPLPTLGKFLEDAGAHDLPYAPK